MLFQHIGNFYFLLGASALPRDSIQVFKNLGIGGLVIASNPNSARDYSHEIRIRASHKLETIKEHAISLRVGQGDDDIPLLAEKQSSSAVNKMTRVGLLVLADDSNVGISKDMDLQELPFLSHFVPSLLNTLVKHDAQDSSMLLVGGENNGAPIELEVFLGYTGKHAVLNKHANVDQIKGLFRERLSDFHQQRRLGLDTGELSIQIHFQQFEDKYATVPGYMWTKMMQKAYDADVDVFVTALDSMVFETPGWIMELLEPIQRNNGMLGVAFPRLNVSRMVGGRRMDKFVHLFPALTKTHYEVFKSLAPQAFANGMFSGYWLANVYSRESTALVSSVRMSLHDVQHADSMVLKLNTRCSRADCLRFIKSEVERDCLAFQQFTFSKGMINTVQKTCVRHLKDLNWWREEQEQ
eukprot:TRINITY_DN7567_c0_g1_i1.p1 TRINITY_DN7567_c0_g1~~TRINITY_DN7567_c0_g1_i1.p1  ORF type:complete len:410 (-),score=98.68 TRINITY_DN7567_c0_g1_i1:515-1744(-)